MALVEQKLIEEGKKVELTYEESPETFQAAVQKVYKNQVKSIQIPGFRKGKAPRNLIERMYGEAVFYEDALNDMLPGMYEDAMKSCEAEVIGKPDVNVEKMSRSEGVLVKFVQEVKPELNVSSYKGLSAPKAVEVVDDHEVEHEIGHLQERNARMITVEDRPAQMGDTVIIDFDGYVDGEQFEGGKSDNFTLELGSHSFIDNFEDQICGHNTGDEFDVNVTFPEDYHAENLSGKPAVFKCKLNEIKFKELPELDDEFAKDVSEFDTMEELRADTKKHLQEDADKRADQDFENALLDKLIENLEGEVPEAMIEDQIDNDLQEFAYRLQSQGISFDMYKQLMGGDESALRNQMRAQSEKTAKIRLALEAVAREENFEVSDEEIEEEYSRIAESYGIEVERVKELVDTKSVRRDVTNRKALEVIKENAVATEPEEEPAEPETEEAEEKKED
ncbi:MAG: trigger factor [Oscillospiraceae bacterium]|nr:trigger factor [Oscillospiraceae bacterium]